MCWKIRDLINWATHYLENKKVDSPRLTAELIAEKITGKNRIHLYIDPQIPLEKEKVFLFKKEIRRRGRRVPLTYITGEQDFMGYRFLILPGVYIPRPETEIVVEKCIDILKGIENHFSYLTVVDIGTGSGNIAISIAKNIKSACIYAIDISSLAIKVARCNAQNNRVSSQIEFLLGDLFSPLESRNLKNKVDLIVSNPPYVERKQMRFLPPEVKKEPDFALDGGEDGLDFYRRIIPESSKWLRKKGGLVLEIGYNQAEEVKKIIEENSFDPPHIINDLNGYPRVVIAYRR